MNSVFMLAAVTLLWHSVAWSNAPSDASARRDGHDVTIRMAAAGM